MLLLGTKGRKSNDMKTIEKKDFMDEKKQYEAPMVEVIEMESEGVIAASQLENPNENGPIEW